MQAKQLARRRWLPEWRKMTWLIVVLNILMLILIVSAASSAHNDNLANCANQTSEFFSQEDCQTFSDAGTGLGVAFVVFLWVLLDMILGLIWLVTGRSGKRDCPACGSAVNRGVTVCPTCSFDFVRAFGAPPTAPA